MHSAEREKRILGLLQDTGFISFRRLEEEIEASPATLRRDLERLSQSGLVSRVRGGAKLVGGSFDEDTPPTRLQGAPFAENIEKNIKQKRMIGKAAAQLCVPNEGVMIDGGSTTLQMCPHLNGLNLQVLTNSLHIVNALLPQIGTRVITPGGAVFREQNIILALAGDESMPNFYGPKLFMGAASIGRRGLMQDDVILVAAEQRLIERADEVVVLVDGSKFREPSGNLVCGLDKITTVITDPSIDDAHAKMIEQAGIRLIVAQ